MKRSTERILTTHVGSLIRPKELLELGKAASTDAGKRPEYEAALKAGVANVVRMQAETNRWHCAKRDLLTDGNRRMLGDCLDPAGVARNS